jgi:hypothetical protein
MQRSQDMNRVLADLPSIEQPRDSPSRSIRAGNTEEFERARSAAERHQISPSLQLTPLPRRGNEPPQLTPLPRRDDEPLQLTPLPRRVRQRAEPYDDAMKRVRGDLGKGKMY